MIEDGATFLIPDDIVPLIQNQHDVVVGAAGGAQSGLGGMKPTLVPPEALLALYHVVGAGSERYARNNWRAIPEEEHLDHVLIHLAKHMAGDRSEKHLWNALTRMAFAVAVAGTRDYRAYENLKSNSKPKSQDVAFGQWAEALPARRGESAASYRKRLIAAADAEVVSSEEAKTGV